MTSGCRQLATSSLVHSLGDGTGQHGIICNAKKVTLNKIVADGFCLRIHNFIAFCRTDSAAFFSDCGLLISGVCIAGHFGLTTICSQHFLLKAAQTTGEIQMGFLQKAFAHMRAMRDLGEATQLRHCMAQQGWPLKPSADFVAL